MDYDFDKEIDTLLRKAHGDGPVYVGDYTSSNHLNADEISAFAENAMPENSRALYSAHLAECTRCRKILSNLLMLNAEDAPAAPAPASAIPTTVHGLPWYRQLFLFPNLAYVMGGLVLVFAGFLGYSVIQDSGGGNAALVSQAPESTETRGGPNFQVESEYPATDSANAAANMSNATEGSIAVNSNTAVAPARTPASGASGPQDSENSFALDGLDASSADTATAPTAAPPPAVMTQPVQKDARENDLAAKEKAEAKTAAGAALPDSAKNNLSLMKQSPGSISQSQVQTQSGPMNRNERQYDRQLENLEERNRAAAKKSAARDEEGSSGRKVVGGKTFERKQGVWYDTAYQGRPTINVRRGSEEFNKLEGGLRSIANAISGTAVIVWGAKAYRIQ